MGNTDKMKAVRLTPRWKTTVEVKFAASHVLHGLDEDHKCGRLHGHNYVAYITLGAAELDDTGFVIDFGLVKEVIRGKYDHKHLNDVMPKGLNPTAEIIAMEITRLMNEMIFRMNEEERVQLIKVKVVETDTSVAELTFVEEVV